MFCFGRAISINHPITSHYQTSDLTAHNLSLLCPNATRQDLNLLTLLSFGVEGLLQLVISLLGMSGESGVFTIQTSDSPTIYQSKSLNLLIFPKPGNATSVFLLTRKELSSFFNHLLAVLCLFDLLYLFTMMLEALRNLGFESSAHTIIFSSFLYPLNAICLMASIYMTLVIGLER